MSINKEIQMSIVEFLKNCEFKKLCDTYFDKNFLWIIKGSSLLSGKYEDKNKFFERVIYRLNKIILPGWKMHILNTYANDDFFIVEMRGEAKAKNGQDYDNEYCWIFKFCEDKIISVTAYYDSLLVNRVISENENA